MDFSGFRDHYPQFSDVARMKALGAAQPMEGARELDLTSDALETFTVATPKDPYEY